MIVRTSLEYHPLGADVGHATLNRETAGRDPNPT
jgi:hypothetical protein